MLRRTLKHQKLMKMLSQSIKRPFRLPKANIQRTFRKVDYSRYKDKFTRSHDYVSDPFAPHESTCSTKSRNMKRRAEARQFLNRSVEIPKFNRNNENPTYIWIEEMGIEPSPRRSRIKTLIYQAKKRNAKRQHRKSFKANDYDRIMKQVYEWKQLKKRVIQEALFQNVVKEWDFYRTFQK
ncbi:unnamed protein product [Moneuplotes crassus]|uniref:Uncharacterized protein n=1 Tax=Euplotes crassus TaxID=5936 RepID=A0AAD1XT69_EUPCR|nr:unnamed protein product [Moneuplotes crassus]